MTIDIEKKLGKLISFISSCSEETEYIPHVYKRLTEKYGFHYGGIWIKNRNRDVFIKNLFTGSDSCPKDLDAIRKTLRMIGKIRFDLDGLKSVNDIGSHDLGDVLLDLVASALSVYPHLRIELKMQIDSVLCSKKISDFCELFDARIEVDRAGGDEFDIYVQRVSGYLDEEISYEILPGKTVTSKFIFLLRDLITLEISLRPFPNMDFHSMEIFSNLGEYGCSLLEKAEKHSGGKFFFTPSVSAGECILWDVLVEFIKNSPYEMDCLSKERLGDILMGMVEDISGNLVTKRKEALKKRLWNSPSPIHNMQAFMLTRSRADKANAILLHKLRRFNAIRGSVSEEIYVLQSWMDCVLAEISSGRNGSGKNGKEAKHFLRDIRECIPVVQDRLFLLDDEIRNLLKE